MSLQRKIDWPSEMREMRNDRAPVASGFMAARSLKIAGLERLAKEATAALPGTAAFHRAAGGA